LDNISFSVLSWFSSTKNISAGEVIPRRYFLTQIGVVLAAIPFTSIIYGMVKGKYDFKLHKVKLYFDNLPENFSGIKIVQISDIHIGSFNHNYKAVEKGIQIINSLNADYVFFTGDFVNNYSDELKDWISVFSKIKAKKGKFSILGNHDYGDYVPWKSAEEKKNNLKQLITYQKEMGFDVLMNENRILRIDNQYIRLVGVENWGKGGFAKYGDLNKALEGTGKNEFKILLSHDPSHFDAHVKGIENIKLTLSGHTHGMQFGVEIGNIKWSPAKYRYPKWAGLYKENNQYLYVNRGFGFIGFPGRVGIWPEITLIELYKS
ncbi:MAG: metallophosphoesterase, partial [Bacteroidetes bacterium]